MTAARLTFIAFFLLAATGCEGDSGPQFAPISGRVTIDGKPAAGLRVVFAPIGSVEQPYPGPQSFGVTDADGRYVLASAKDKTPGAVVGPCRVRIDVRVALPKSVEEARTLVVKRLPPRYNDQTVLRFGVPREGTDTANFDVSWE